MAFKPLPEDARDAMKWSWEDFEHHFDDLAERPVTEETVDAWLADWSKLATIMDEALSRLYVVPTLDTSDEAAKTRLTDWMANIQEKAESRSDHLRRKLIESGFTPDGMEVPMKKMKADVSLFREANLPLFTKLVELGNKYDKLVGKRSVTVDEEELTLPQADALLEDPDRGKREDVWRKKHDRILEDRKELNSLWQQMFAVRQQIAVNAGSKSFNTYQFLSLHRFDYTPEDCASFRSAIEEKVVPAASKIYEERRKLLGLDALRPWDLDVDPFADQPLNPYDEDEELTSNCHAVFQELDHELAAQFEDMNKRGLLDLFSRKNKAGGGYCTSFDWEGVPFIFMNAAGTHDNVQTLLHEAGHAFHVYAQRDLPLYWQHGTGSEFAEVASMAMEFLSGPHLDKFYDRQGVARARLSHFERQLLFWPYMAIVDGFQHWAYDNPADGRDPEKCDAKWEELSRRFMPDIDWSGLSDEERTGWHRKLHIYQVPHYYVEYGLAQMGALQVWQNSLSYPAKALADYRASLALGGTKSLPELFAAAGGKFAFDGETLGSLVNAMTDEMQMLKTELATDG